MHTVLKVLSVMAALSLGTDVALSQTSPSGTTYPSYTAQTYPQMKTFTAPAPGTEYRWDGNHLWYWSRLTSQWSFWNGRSWTPVLSSQMPPVFTSYCPGWIVPK